MASAINGDVRSVTRESERWIEDLKGVRDGGRSGGAKVEIAKMNDWKDLERNEQCGEVKKKHEIIKREGA
jgi:hypothetical protein